METIEYQGIIYNPVEISNTYNVLEVNIVKDLIPEYIDDGACLLNAYKTAKTTGATCIEGFVLCRSTINGADEFTVIRHCWNNLNDKNFDVTKDFVWDKKDILTRYAYYAIKEYTASEYNPNHLEHFRIEFISNVVAIATGIEQEISEYLTSRNKK